jgi:hypothetical protein
MAGLVVDPYEPPYGRFIKQASMVAKSISRGWRITIMVITGILILLIAGCLLLDTYLTPKLSAKLKSAVLAGSDSLYHIDFSKAELNVWQGKAVLSDVRLVPDTAAYHRLQGQGRAPAEVYELGQAIADHRRPGFEMLF